jgi:hypothetical protein
MADWAAELEQLKEDAKRKRDAAASTSDGGRRKYVRRSEMVRADRR